MVLGLFGSRKKNVNGDELPAVPPSFAPEEVHTAYKEALARDALPSTQLPPAPKNVWPAPVQDSFAPIGQPETTKTTPKSSSLDDALSDVHDTESTAGADPLTTMADLPVGKAPSQEKGPATIPVPATSVQEEISDPSASLAPEGEVSPAPDANQGVVSAPQITAPSPVATPVTSFADDQQSIDAPVPNTPLEEKVSSFDKEVSLPVSTPVVDAPTLQSTYQANSTNPIADYSSQPLPEFSDDDAKQQAVVDDLSPIAPQEEPQEAFDTDQLPEIGVPVDEYQSNMAAKPAFTFKNKVSSASVSQTQMDASPSALPPFDLEPPAKPSDLPSSLPEDNPDDLIAPELAPLDATTKVYAQPESAFTDESSAVQNQFSPSQPAAPVEERVILKHAVGTDVFVEKYIYEDALLNVSAVQKDLQNAGSHLDKVLRDELAVTKKIGDWNATLNVIQEQLMSIDIRLFEKGDV